MRAGDSGDQDRARQGHYEQRSLPGLLAHQRDPVLAFGSGSRAYASTQQPSAAATPNHGPADENVPTFPGPPQGARPLPVDVFTTKNFYKDAALWTDKRYFHRLSPRQMMESYRLYGERPGYPATAPLGRP